MTSKSAELLNQEFLDSLPSADEHKQPKIAVKPFVKLAGAPEVTGSLLANKLIGQTLTEYRRAQGSDLNTPIKDDLNAKFNIGEFLSYCFRCN